MICFLQDMSILTGNLLIDIVGLVVALFSVLYAHFHRAYQIWKRKNVPYFQPTFPNGNRQPIWKDVNLAEDVFDTVQKAKQQGERYNLFITITRYISF